jgi:DNA-directed RNA polymerase subunit RPC12/RpoP
MTITLHCMDCGFRFSVTVPRSDASDLRTGALSCGQCGCRRWTAH